MCVRVLACVIFVRIGASGGCPRAQDCPESAIVRGEDGRSQGQRFGSRRMDLVRNKALLARIAKVRRAVMKSVARRPTRGE